MNGNMSVRKQGIIRIPLISQNDEKPKIIIMLTILKSCAIIECMLNERDLKAVRTLMEAEKYLMATYTPLGYECIDAAASFYTPSFITVKDKLATINLESDYIERLELPGTIIKRHFLKPERHENHEFNHDVTAGLYIDDKHGLSFTPSQMASYANNAHENKTHDSGITLQGLDEASSSRIILKLMGTSDSITYVPVEHTANNNKHTYDAIDILASHH